jgi:putative endonuclease
MKTRRVLIAPDHIEGVARHFLYIVACADGSLYTGYTTDPARRVAEHNSGKGARYTRSRRPVVLAFLEESRSRAEALRREIQIKRMSRRDKLLLCRRYRGRGAPSLR